MGGRELATKVGNLELREMRAKASLREIRLKGHAYVELRRDGKRPIFFCVLCLAPLYSDSVLFDHLQGKFHARRYAAAKATLFGTVPWPFSDGVLFFNTSCEKEQNKSVSVCQNDGGTSRFIRRNGNRDSNSTDGTSSLGRNGNDRMLNHNDNSLMIPRILVKEEITDLRARFLGYGHIGSRIHETDEDRSKISKIWCAWMGQRDSEGSNEFLASPKCDFAIVNFLYTYDLGRKAALDDLNSPPSPGSFFEIDDSGHRKKKRKKSFSDPEDYFEGLNSRHCSSGKDCPDLSGCAADASHQLQTSRHIPSKTDRRELRRHKRLTAERTCGICCQPMLAEKDVATLLNCRTGKLACSSRNINGAFHIFHVSCLIHWILFREFQTWTIQSTNIKPTTRGRKAKLIKKEHISSVFCPECQGTGIHIEGDELERPTVSLSEMFHYKLKTIEAQKEWMKNPEILNKCSTGLHFTSDSAEKLQEKVINVKLLHFYRADI